MICIGYRELALSVKKKCLLAKLTSLGHACPHAFS